MTTVLEADYLVVGAGAMGMAFTDVLMTESGATAVLVDRHHQPGGHWNDAYPFVRLHQPSAFYGVNSRKLGSDAIDATGWNQGLHELATGGEVCAYLDQVMQQQFLASGRVQYFPMCEYTGDRRFRSRIGDEDYEVRCRKVVDATYMNVRVPQVTPPAYEVADGETCVPLNALPQVGSEFERYTVIGAGKTGMDACLFLLRNGVDPDAVTWVMPRDSWILDRAQIQPGKGSDDVLARSFGRQLEVIAAAESMDDMFERLDDEGLLLRIDRSVKPTMYRCATVTGLELEQLRRIRDVIRMGRVKCIEKGRLELEQGSRETPAGTLFVDCTADGLAERPAKPVFDGDHLTLQAVRVCQQVFSAAFTAHVECAYDDEAVKNHLCAPVPHPNTHLDFLRTTLQNGANQAKWAGDPELLEWLHASRLDGFTPARAGDAASPEADAIRQASQTAAGKLMAWLAQAQD